MPEKFEVVISGISGRFPECNDVETFKRMLYNQESPMTYDNRKWPVNYKFKFGDEIVPLGTGKYLDIQRFDARVFACSAALAKCTDIINRKVLEPSFEAVMDAGINPTTLMGANVGCFMSSCINEVESIKIFTRMSEKFFIVGGSKAMCSNRVSFALNLTGPSFTFGGGVYGGLEALAAAYQNIAKGRIESAIVGGSSSVIDPKLSINFLRLGYLSPDGLTKSFDADANGYGRSEGAVVLFLQRAQDAKRSYGILKLSESFYYGMNPYTFVGFNEDTIEISLKEIYENNQHKVKPSDVCFLEMDACGVKFREKQEVEAVDRVFCNGRSDSLLVGSVKSHCGHVEGAASYISLLKCLFALDSGYIAPNMHFSKPNSELRQLKNGKLKVVAQKTKLPGTTVGINAFSFFGATSHAVIEQHPKEAEVREGDKDDTLPRLLIFCGRTEADMERVIDKVKEMPLNKEFIYISNDVFKMPIMTHVFRGYTIIPPNPQAVNEVEVCKGENRPVWFVFSGMGSQWNGMGKALLSIPIFAKVIEQCDAVLRPEGIDIYAIITSDDPNIFDNIVHAFVGIISVQVGLMNILRALGIEPDGIIGHSVGENACAYADGCLTLEQAVLASYARGIASNEAETIKGMMAAIGRGYNQIKDDLPEGIEVACHNSDSNCTLTGPAEIVKKFVEKLQEEKIFARAVNVSNIAYHSRHIAPAAPHLLRRLNEVIKKPATRSPRWISTSVSEDKWDSPLAKMCSAEYLTNNLVNPVLFEEGCKHIPENAIVIEIAPHGLLQAILKRSLHKTCTNISMTSRSSGSNSVGYLLSSIGKMYIAGCQPDVNAIFPKIEYPVSRGTPSTALLATWDHSECWENICPIKDRPLSGEILTIKLNEGSKFNFIKGHEIKNQKVIPSSLYLYFVWYMFATIKNEKMENQNIIFENIKVHRDLHITLEKPRRLTLMIQYGSGDFEMLLTEKKEDEEPVVILTGTIQIAYESKPITINQEDMLSQTKKKIYGHELYKRLENIGFKLDNSFARIMDMTYTATECFGKIAWSDNWISFLDCLMKFHIYSNLDKNDLFFPVRIRRLEIHATEFNTMKLGDEIICQKDLVTQKLRCNGVEMVGFVHDNSTISTFLDTNSSQLKMEAMHFICYSDPQLKNKEMFLSFCLELIIESLVLSTNKRDTKVQIVDTTHSMMEEMKKVIKQRTELKTYFMFSNSIHDLNPGNASLLISHNLREFEKLQQKMNQNSKPVFALTISAVLERDNSTTNLPSMVEITKQSFDDVNIHLYKKVNFQLTEKQNCNLSVINASDDTITKLLPKLESNKSKPVTVIRRSVDPTDLDIICTEQKLYSNVRYIFLMDNDAPSFSIENPFYQKQIERELPINILKDGQWGSYRSTSSYIKYTSQYVNDSKINYHNFRMKNVELKYLTRISKEDMLKNTILGDCNVEYSGVDASGQQIMGLGRVTANKSKYEPDTHFMWLVPRYWSLEVACTVPLVYLQINHILFTSDHKYLTFKRSIFVHSSDSFFKEACINVALHHNLDIFVAVSDEERTIFLQKFPMLNKSNLLNQINYEYEIELKLSTRGEGVDVVINDNASSEHLEATLNCTKQSGFYTFIGKNNVNKTESKFGMFMFLNNIVFKYMPNTNGFFLKLAPEVKALLHSRIECGIRNGAIKPLMCETHKRYEPTNSSQVTVKVKQIHECINFSNNEMPKKWKNKVQFDDRHSYILISRGQKIDLWFELLEWLISQGAQKFMIAIDDQGIAPKFCDKINCLLNETKGCSITIKSMKIDTVEDAEDLIVEANRMQSLEAIFFIGLADGDVTFQMVDKVTRLYPPIHYISLFSGGLKECEHRKRHKLPAIVIHSKNRINKFSSITTIMEQFFNQESTLEKTCLYNLIDKTFVEKNIQSNCLSQLLSNDLDTLECIGYRATNELQFQEVVSLSRKYSVAKGSYPLFVIPGIDETFIKPLLQNLIYPVFCATFTEKCDSPLESARQLLKHIQIIQPDGPVSIVGDTWGGPITIELASLLQAEKRKVKTFLVEGSPFTWQQRIQTLGQMDTLEFDSNFLETMLNINLKHKINANQSWKDVLNQILNKSQKKSVEKRNIIKAVSGIRRRLITIATYTQPQERLKHVVLFKQVLLESCLEKYSLSNAVHLFNEDKYSDFLKNKEMAVSINKKALFRWWK